MRSRPLGSGGGSAGRGFRNAGDPPFGPLLPQFPKPAAALRPPASSRFGAACAVRDVLRCGQLSGVQKFFCSGTVLRILRAEVAIFTDSTPRRRAGEYGRIVRLETHDGRISAPWGSPSWKRRPPLRRESTADSTTLAAWGNTMSAARTRLRLGLVTAAARDCLRAERQGRRRSVRFATRDDRCGRPTASSATGRPRRGPARPGFAAQRRGNRAFRSED